MVSMQGTYEFMSKGLVNAVLDREPHLHSPVDDLESFYYTAQWATAFNDGASGGRHNGTTIQQFREKIAGDRREQATATITRLHPIAAETDYGPFFARSLPLLAPWRLKSDALHYDWTKVLHDASLLGDKDKEEYLHLNFLIFGYRGVGEYLELIREHRDLLQRPV